MWWEPLTRRDELLLLAVEQLTRWFREQPRRDKDRIAWGVGSVWSESLKALMPLVLLNSERIPPSLLSRAPEGIVFPMQLVSESFPDFFPASLLPEIDSSLPPPHAMLVTRPRPSNVLRDTAESIVENFLHFHEPIICEQTGSLGTAGVTVRYQDTGGYGLLTAGHVFPRGLGSAVSRRRRGFLRSTIDHIGRVSHHEVPDGQVAGWDAAIIQLDKSLFRFQGVKIRRMLQRLDKDESVVVEGATTGLVKEAAVLRGAMVEGGSEDMMWKNCWTLAPSGVLTSELDHLGVRFRLREHEAAKLSPGERSLLVKDHLTQIFFHRQLSFLVRVEGQVIPILHLGQLQLEVRRRPFAGMTIPPVGEQGHRYPETRR
jgi:hypothetical protein